MKLRKLSLLLIFTLCLSLVPAAVFASGPAVTIDAIGEKAPGGAVVISGTSTLDEVIIKVLRPENSVLFYAIAKVSGGKFSSTFTLAASEASGTYKVVAGEANQVAAADLIVKSANTGGEDGNGNNGGNNGGPIGTITAPTPTPAAGKPVTPGKSGAEPVIADTSKNITASATAGNGQVTTTVTQDSAALADALAKAPKQDNHGAAPIIFIAFDNAAGEAVQFSLSSSVLAAAALSAPNSIISLQTNDGEYSLPLSIIDFASLEQSLGTTAANISILVKISTTAADLNAKIKQSAQAMSASQLGNAIEFTLVAAGNGKTIELNSFGSTYVERTVALTGSVDAAHASVVRYEPSTGQFSFVPAIFEKQPDGSTKVAFKRNGNSIYTVLSVTKTFNDISQHWASADIELLASKLVINGVTDNTFAPNSNITRAEFAALLVRSLGLASDASSAAFTDVKSSDWYAGAVGAAVKAKLVDGFDGNRFKPNDTITREQMAVMVTRAIAAAGITSGASTGQNEPLTKFKDQAAISSWAQAAVAEAIEANIITGLTADTFAPSEKATRAQASVMLKRLMQYVHFIN
ncbi:S-layer homology domain-containing protein [Paenibacillus sp. FJAT-27812]|uniref:S-layer homology domain-containing protein n=1 Tax=Paenibacillus sp. FJAT-27812 TaxID=1684143 RepID=UPI0006A7C5BE|nr:S-layer homology domain-containing protein [Paenibacillus sp. FJAT-27812]